MDGMRVTDARTVVTTPRGLVPCWWTLFLTLQPRQIAIPQCRLSRIPTSGTRSVRVVRFEILYRLPLEVVDLFHLLWRWCQTMLHIPHAKVATLFLSQHSEVLIHSLELFHSPLSSQPSSLDRLSDVLMFNAHSLRAPYELTSW